MAATAAAQSVLTERDLFIRIVNFQTGWTLPVLLRWGELKSTNRTAFIDMLLRERDLVTLKAAMEGAWYEQEVVCRFQVLDLKPAVASGDPAVLEWALTWVPTTSVNASCCFNLFVQAIQPFPGHCAILQILHEHGLLPKDSNSYDRARFITGGKLPTPLVQWMAANIGHISLPTGLLLRSAISGDLELVQCLVGVSRQFFHPWSYGEIYSEILFKQHQQKVEQSLRLRQVLEYLLHHCREPHDSLFLLEVIKRGDIAMFCLIQRLRGLNLLNTAMVTAAAAGGHVEMARIAIEAKPELATIAPMEAAASNGQLDALKLLYLKGTDRCSPASVSAAASSGRLDIIQFLHEHDTSSFSVFTMDDAARNGHWDVVDFFVENHPEFSTVAVVNSAIRDKRLDLAQRYAQGAMFSEIQWCTLPPKVPASSVPSVSDRDSNLNKRWSFAKF